MRKGPIYSLFIVSWFILSALVVSAQHFISVQSADKVPFAITINGTLFNSAKTGLLRISNLSGGTYNLLINFAGDKYPSQNFSCTVGKDDQSYILKNEPQIGWVLKDIKSGKELATVSGQDDENMLEGRKGPGKINVFAKMLAEVADDSGLLKPTVWVYTTKIDGSGADETTADAPQAADDKGYVAATKGVIKASEEDVNGGTEMVFVDFNGNGADTIHLMVPSTDVAANTVADSSSVAHGNTSTDTSQTATFGTAPHSRVATRTDSAAVTNQPPVNEVAVTKNDTLAFDTSSNKQLINPFFNKGTSTVTAADASVKGADTSTGVPFANKGAAVTKIVDTAKPDYASLQHTAAAPPTNAAADSTSAAVPHDLSRTDCKKMLTDAAAEKLKHKIYLETDENKMINIAHNYLDGRCITTQQVKDLAGFFLSDDARLRFFKTMYPSVYDIGNFGSLGSYMIDANYKQQFQAILK